jgi:hypothetical protein
LNDKRRSVLPGVLTEERVETGFEGLLPEEEKALRMLHGLSEDGDSPLAFAVGADMETRLKLAMIEQDLLKAFARTDAPHLDLEDRHLEAKSKIIEKLKGK